LPTMSNHSLLQLSSSNDGEFARLMIFLQTINTSKAFRQQLIVSFILLHLTNWL
jgi:hypothetical protein